MNECCACGAINHLEYFDPEASAFADGSRLANGALLCHACVGATTLRRIKGASAAAAGSRLESATASR
ncbi:MAG: hypothetical protein M9925_00635 [Chloroflexi bacterium]|jgi:hypothetical protein|nr:hypothetical protein [Dehalococcoidia bacterium]MCO5200200.1 hypothetical protein [Chloroflexota bacterium]MCZ7579078.1 hypothetical protein [Dehalococcoidia bacterium]NJD66626.1 hypothetical protein [Chloroflexota bacterium]PWB48385.1 MAG: hypothetical protein C3F10_01325 [Dehalococcoidia bacterium]